MPKLIKRGKVPKEDPGGTQEVTCDICETVMEVMDCEISMIIPHSGMPVMGIECITSDCKNIIDVERVKPKKKMKRPRLRRQDSL